MEQPLTHFLGAPKKPMMEKLLHQAMQFKHHPYQHQAIGKNKTIGLLFFNPSMRTRISTQLAASHLGMKSVIFNLKQEGWMLEFEDEVVMNGTNVEHIRDAAPVMGKYFDLLAVRTFPSLTDKEKDDTDFYIQQFVKYAGIPVISLESATRHPLQSLADLITIEEHKPAKKPKVVLTWAPHVKAIPHCVANSFLEWMHAWQNYDLVLTHPKGYELNPQFVQDIPVVHEQAEALRDADFVYVKNWSSYTHYGTTPPVSENWMLTLEKLNNAPNAKIMHCLPVRRNVELASDVLDSPRSLTTLQAENRVWAAQSVLYQMLTSHE